MDEQSVYRSLRETALCLRPPVSGRMISLIQVANDHSIDVNLVFGREFDRARDLARCELGMRPAISLYRQAAAGAVACLSPSDEAALTTRERFSVAHELGHCLAYLMYEFRPLGRGEDSQRYWRQERAMDEFAGALLVPPWLVEQWVEESSGISSTCVFRLGRWAADSAVSSEVVAKALCRAVPDIGFLKVAEAKRLRDGARLFVVLYSSTGERVRLPNQHSHLKNEDFLARIVGRTGAQTIHGYEVGANQLGQVEVAWIAGRTSVSSRRREFRSTIRLSGASYWICLMNQSRTANAKQRNLLFSAS